jgi:hypothetical protein
LEEELPRYEFAPAWRVVDRGDGMIREHDHDPSNYYKVKMFILQVEMPFEFRDSDPFTASEWAIPVFLSHNCPGRREVFCYKIAS